MFERRRTLVASSVLAGVCMGGVNGIFPTTEIYRRYLKGRVIIGPLRPSGRGVPALVSQLGSKEPDGVSVSHSGDVSGGEFPLVIMTISFVFRISHPVPLIATCAKFCFFDAN